MLVIGVGQHSSVLLSYYLALIHLMPFTSTIDACQTLQQLNLLATSARQEGMTSQHQHAVPVNTATDL